MYDPAYLRKAYDGTYRVVLVIEQLLIEPVDEILYPMDDIIQEELKDSMVDYVGKIV